MRLSAVIKRGLTDLHMALGRGDKADGAMVMLVVVPVHRLCRAAPRL